MERTVLPGDHVVVNKFLLASRVGGLWDGVLPSRSIRRGDILVFKFPEDPRRDFIKRAIGLPGETIEIRDKTVFVNGRLLEEPYAVHTDTRTWPDDPRVPEQERRRDQLASLRVPEGSVFALGDNRDHSDDSRDWGPVSIQNVKGRALLVYWSLRPADGPARGPVPWLADLPGRLRWSRTLRPVR